MVLEKLGSSLYDAIRKVIRAPVVDEELVKELVRDFQRALLQADVNVQLVMGLSQDIERKALDEELPPVVYDLVQEVQELRARVEHLESSSATSFHLGELNDKARNELCTDELDRKLLAYFIKNEGATTPELAEGLLGHSDKRRTVLDRIDRLNTRGKKLFGSPVLEYKKGFVKNKRGAWWITSLEHIIV